MPLTNDEYNILYREKAVPQPIKSQANTAYLMLKTSTFFIPRVDVSYNLNPKAVGELYDLIRILELNPTIQQLMYRGNLMTKRDLVREAHKYFSPIEGAESLHYALNDMELNDVGLYAADSAMKKILEDANEIGEENRSYEVPNSAIRKNVETAGMKSENIHGVQVQQLITSEISNQAKIFVNTMKMSGSAAKMKYKEILAQRIREGVKEKRQALIDIFGEAEYKYMLEEFQKTISGINGNPYVQEMFSSDEGVVVQPKYDLNFPGIVSKFEALYLSFFNKNSLKQYVPGTKLVLVPEMGFPVLESNGKIITRDKIRETRQQIIEEYADKPESRVSQLSNLGITSRTLRHRVKDSDGTYYSEVMVSKAFAKLLGLKIGENIPEKYLKFFGVRIPTQDKHSMLNMKIVDFVDASMGNALIAPSVLVKIAGWDFDHPFVMAHILASEKINGKLIAYGEYADWFIDQGRKGFDQNEKWTSGQNRTPITTLRRIGYKNRLWKLMEANSLEKARTEFYMSLLHHPIIMKEHKERKCRVCFDDPTTYGWLLKIIEQKKELLPHFDENLVRENIVAYSESRIQDVIPITRGEMNNLLLHLQRGMLHYDSLDRPAISEFTTVFEQLKIPFLKLGLLNASIVEAFSFGNKAKLEDMFFMKQNDVDFIKSFNILFQSLAGKNFGNYKFKLFGELGFKVIIGEHGRFLDDKARRINDVFSEIITKMIKNEEDSRFFNFSGNSLLIICLALAVGKTIEFATYLINQPIVVEFLHQLELNKGNLNVDRPKSRKEIIEYLKRKYRITSAKRTEIDRLIIESAESNLLNDIQDPSPEIQRYALESVVQALNLSFPIYQLTKLFSLLNGRGNNFSEVAGFSEIIHGVCNGEFVFDMTEVFEDNPHLNAAVTMLNDANEIDEKFFTLENQTCKYILKIIRNSLNEFNIHAYGGVDQIRRQLLVFLNMKVCKNKLISHQAFKILFTPELQREIRKARNLLGYGSNKFLEMIISQSPKQYYRGSLAGMTFYGISINTRSHLMPQTVEDIMDDFISLFYSEYELVRRMAYKLLKFLIVKDGFLFRNGSFVNMVEPHLLKELGVFDVTGSIRTGLVDPENFKRVFGMSRNELITEFTLSFLRYSGNRKLLNTVDLKLVKNARYTGGDVFKISEYTREIGKLDGFKDRGKGECPRYEIPLAFKYAGSTKIYVLYSGRVGNLKFNSQDIEGGRLPELLTNDGKMLVDEFIYVVVNTEGTKDVFNYYLNRKEFEKLTKEK